MNPAMILAAIQAATAAVKLARDLAANVQGTLAEHDAAPIREATAQLEAEIDSAVMAVRTSLAVAAKQ